MTRTTALEAVTSRMPLSFLACSQAVPVLDSPSLGRCDNGEVDNQLITKGTIMRKSLLTTTFLLLVMGLFLPMSAKAQLFVSDDTLDSVLQFDSTTGAPLGTFDSGFGLARAQKPLNLTPIKLGDSTKLEQGSQVIIAAHGGPDHCISATIIDRHEFAGYWEYLLETAIFTAPAHPNWSGAALIGVDGLLYGIGSLLIDDAANDTVGTRGNMFVPIELLRPILDDLLSAGRVRRPPRPWLGMFTAETQTGLVVVHLTPEGPAHRSGLALDDVILRVAEEPSNDLAHMYRKMWNLGDAGTVLPLTVMRDAVGVEVTVKSASRYDYFRTPRD